MEKLDRRKKKEKRRTTAAVENPANHCCRRFSISLSRRWLAGLHSCRFSNSYRHSFSQLLRFTLVTVLVRFCVTSIVLGKKQSTKLRLIAFGTRHGRNYISDSKDDFHIVMNILSNSAPSRGGHQIYSALDAALDDVTNLDKHFVLKVIETSCQTKLLHTPRVPPSDLIRYLKLVWKNNKDLITTSVVQSLVSSICCSTSPTQRPTKNDLLFLWDFLNHIARYHPPGLLNAPILNTLIQSLGGEGKAALDVFNKFQVFHCVPNHDTYYFTLQALLNTSTCSPDMIHQAASICQNMMLLLPPHDHHHGGSSHDQ
ncbi:pentatricopeptide repeat-containing protein [Trifolium pratense]|uniref:Pentatricopeptide repeat-containing protein n=1 Tax=Trifolium pratense TaxID=57577 RepID=A0A2K3PJX0_TRIPR|nr:pentatricopeptide repeat-containing protein [Trifolium pratense]